jgi:MBG domain (YGX type)
MRTRLRSKVTLLFIVCAALLAVGGTAISVTADPSGTTSLSPTITSDKADYKPGELVTLTGSNWQQDQSVNIVVNDDQGQTWSRNVDVTVDPANGDISDSFNLPDWFVATYKVTATGKQSGAVATASFTDGAVSATSTGLSASNPAETWTLKRTQYTSADCSGSGSASPDLTVPASGASATTGNQLTGQNHSVKLEASALSSPANKKFDNWSWPADLTVSDPASPTTQLSSPSTKSAICVHDNANGNKTVTANYIPATAATTLTVDAASGAYGGTTTLTATLKKTSDGTFVNDKTIVFSLRGSAVCDNNTADATKPDCPKTNTSGVATLNNVSLSGIDAGGPTGLGYENAVSANFEGDSGFSASSGTANLTVNKATQTITFDALGNKTFGDAPFDLSATGGASGNPVTFALGTDSKGCSLSGTNNKTVTITGATALGEKCIIVASQAGNANYLDAASVTRDFTIAKASLTVTANNQTKILGASDPSFTFTYSSFVNNENSGVIDTPPTCGVSVTHTDVGSYPIVCSGGADNNYSITYVNGTLNILYSFSGYLQPINDTAHQPVTGVLESKFKLGQTIPVKFNIYNSAGIAVQQATNPTFTKVSHGACDSQTALEAPTTETPNPGVQFVWTTDHYQYNWSTKGLSAGEYRIHANLADGTGQLNTDPLKQNYTDICLTK